MSLAIFLTLYFGFNIFFSTFALVFLIKDKEPLGVTIIVVVLSLILALPICTFQYIKHEVLPFLKD